MGNLVRNLKHRRRSNKMQRGIAAAFVLLLGIYTSYFHVVVMADIDLHSGDLTCDHVIQGFRKFFSGEYDHSTDLKFRRHLDHCSACRLRLTEHLRDRQYRAPVVAWKPLTKADGTLTTLRPQSDSTQAKE
ncbi:MAG: hypothetical protein AB7O26_02050 [Planctomycetaceae bacterium]